MEQLAGLSAYYAELLEGRYDGVDRIDLNGYFRLGQQCGGFRTWWREVTGSDATLDQDHLLRLAGRFPRWPPKFPHLWSLQNPPP